MSSSDAAEIVERCGYARYSMTLSHYELVPPNVQQSIIAQYGKKKHEEE